MLCSGLWGPGTCSVSESWAHLSLTSRCDSAQAPLLLGRLARSCLLQDKPVDLYDLRPPLGIESGIFRVLNRWLISLPSAPPTLAVLGPLPYPGFCRSSCQVCQGPQRAPSLLLPIKEPGLG